MSAPRMPQNDEHFPSPVLLSNRPPVADWTHNEDEDDISPAGSEIMLDPYHRSLSLAAQTEKDKVQVARIAHAEEWSKEEKREGEK